MDASILAQELAPLNAQIEQARKRLQELQAELRVAEAEVETFAEEEKRFDLLRQISTALEQLGELDAQGLFWEGLPGSPDPAEHLIRLQARTIDFEEETREAREVRDSLQAMVDQQLDELDYLHEEVHDAYAREERRQEEFVVERDLSPVPYRQMVMPWHMQGESERRFRKVLLGSLFWSLLFGILIPLVTVPIPDRRIVMPEIPERLAMLVKSEPPKPAPVPKRLEREEKASPDKVEPTKADQKQAKADQGKKSTKPKATPSGGSGGGGSQTARSRAETTGVLAFKSSFEDLMDEVPVARLGAEARLNKNVPQVAGQARAHRSLVAMQGSGGSGGISNLGVSTNLGNGGNGGGAGYGRGGGFGRGNGTGSGDGDGIGFGRVESAVAGLKEEAGRPLSDGPGPGRTDEEIQIVFDRYKATLYRIYNKKLREDPTLRGKLLLRLTIEPGGEVSLCRAESTDLASEELVAQIVERVKRFNFGPKEGVPKTTILYPIDFLPAG
ncbi:MAG: AgmX/PglI C-terminal domain-containing protein [Syntrophotaleaceae bacterium]